MQSLVIHQNTNNSNSIHSLEYTSVSADSHCSRLNDDLLVKNRAIETDNFLAREVQVSFYDEGLESPSQKHALN